MMAEAHGKATGMPGICFVTRGPGATNASPGIHIASGSTPLIVFVGQIAREMREREAFQEVDYRAVFGTMTKWTTEIDEPRAFPNSSRAPLYRDGRPAGAGGDRAAGRHADRTRRRAECAPVRAGRDLARPHRDVASSKVLWSAKKPVAIIGGSRWSEKACAAMQRFAERFELPVINSFRRGHLFDQTHPCYGGDLGVGPNPKIVARSRMPMCCS